MAKNQAATNPNPRPLLEALVDIDWGRASRGFNRPEGRNASVGRDDCRPAEYNVRPGKALLSPFGGIGITYRIVGGWVVFLLDRSPTASSDRTVTGRIARRPFWRSFQPPKANFPQFWKFALVG